MALFRWGSAFDAFRDLEREMDRWIRRLDMATGSRSGRVFPALNLYELEYEYLLVGELPGVDIQDLEVSVAGGQLRLSGERRLSDDVEDDRYRRRERSCGAWNRQIQLPPRVQEDQIRAELVHGILKLHLPKMPTTEPRKIAIQDASSSQLSLPGGAE
ncbi:MAG: Hsp20/alpha crystallin family protein [Planctomycetaceae bacterium]